MDIMSVLGLILAVALVIFRMVFDQEAMQVTFSNIRAFVDCPGMAITIGGTIGVMILSFPPKPFKRIGEHLEIISRPRRYEPRQSIGQIVELAAETRMKGLLPLEDKLVEVDKLFLYNGPVLIVDSVDSEKVKQVTETELEQLDECHALDYAFHEKAAAYSPAFGMIGALVDLILMLGNVSDVDVLTKGMATVLIITLYDSLITNATYLPIAGKLKTKHDEEFLCKQLVIEGVLAIQEGENPKFIGEKLSKPLPAIFVGQETNTETEEEKGLFRRNKSYAK